MAVTAAADVSRGQFSGGQIATTTRGGTNIPQGTLTFNMRDPALSWGDANAAFGGAGRNIRASGGYGGPSLFFILQALGTSETVRRVPLT